MITAILFVYGYKNQIGWGDWHFLELPRPGDLVALTLPSRELHEVVVRAVEHRPTLASHSEDSPAVIVVTDWKQMYDADGMLVG